MALNNQILGIVTLLYLCLFLMHLVFFASKKEKVYEAMWLVLYGTFALHSIGLDRRGGSNPTGWGLGHAPLSNFYESLIFSPGVLASFLSSCERS